MEALTREQALALSKEYHELSKSLGDYRFANWNSLTEGQRQEIESKEWSLLNFSSDLLALSSQMLFDDLNDSLVKITNATDQLSRAIKTVTTVQKIIEYSTLAVKLGAAITTGNPVAIGAVSLEITDKVI